MASSGLISHESLSEKPLPKPRYTPKSTARCLALAVTFSSIWNGSLLVFPQLSPRPFKAQI